MYFFIYTHVYCIRIYVEYVFHYSACKEHSYILAAYGGWLNIGWIWEQWGMLAMESDFSILIVVIFKKKLK